MSASIRMGFSFGLASGIITTLGLMIGLHSGTHSKLAVIGGVLTIAMADALSDAMGVHFSEEAEELHSAKEVWEATLITLISKAAFASLFIVPLLLLKLSTAIAVNVVLGLTTLSAFSFYLARRRGIKAWKVVAEHLIIAIAVMVLAHQIGEWISATFA